MQVTLDVWRLRPRVLPAMLWRVATGPAAVRRAHDVPFMKMLGTGRGSGFGPRSADLGRWAAITVWNGEPRPHAAVDRLAAAHCRLLLDPLTSHGRWSGHEPFGRPAKKPDGGPILVLTRARLRPTRAIPFWRAIGPVAATLRDAPGLLATLGVGEAPLGFQGTVSIWADAADVSRFAYRTAEHANVVAETQVRRWYAESLFARLAVLDVVGAREVLGWR
ncbi:hypothetical protein Val02_67540 [Virgisporangium aliadipatigenens]|uniref:Spheroidene monooxygenase n=2 Tax=Virgisporangium aliadipatigenens TaxID=741659 RepID=A0A8J3YUA0_9ACTN|nr:hypothetical protein Val02_67540 [Virgisporangium aliadipatigenens]